MKQTFLLLLFSLEVFAGGPPVPSQLQFGGMTLKITPSAQQIIQKHVDALHASERHHQMAADKARLYFPIIERIFAEERVPDAIKYLAIQESSLIPDAVSSANAVGYWQFKDFTAREVGLRVDRQVDERKNIVSASYGAAKYLKQNNFYYNNWIYAVMAYNTGRGGAKKHLDESNFGASKMTINEDTHWYVLKFLAHYIAFRETTTGPHSQDWQLAEFTKGANRDLRDIAREFNVEDDKINEYNKWVNGRIPDDKTYTVIIPVQGKIPNGLVAYSRPEHGRIKDPVTKKYPDELIPGLKENEKTTMIKMNGIQAILANQSDDVLSISARANISEKAFRKYNEMRESDDLIPGEFYYTGRKKSKSGIQFHVVQYNETLWDISQKYGVRMSKLASMNGFSIIDDMEPGRVLLLSRKLGKGEEVKYVTLKKPEPQKIISEKKIDETATIPSYAPSSDQNDKVKIHTVAKGEGLWSIAKKYGVTVEELQRWNQLGNADQISEGQNLQVKAPLVERASKRVVTTYEVVKGDTLFQISRKFGMSIDDILELNGMRTPDLSIGQKLKVYQQ
jgi:membrane-bound lytic murein transglycosylase D